MKMEALLLEHENAIGIPLTQGPGSDFELQILEHRNCTDRPAKLIEACPTADGVKRFQALFEQEEADFKIRGTNYAARRAR